MQRFLLLLLMLLLPWQGAWAAGLKPCMGSGPCGGESSAAVHAAVSHGVSAVAVDVSVALADTAPDAADTALDQRCGGDCQACHGTHLQALLGDITVRLLPADPTGSSDDLSPRHQHQRAPLLRPPWPQPAA